MKRLVFFPVLLLCGCLIPALAQRAPQVLYGPHDNGKTYTSLEEALTEPQQVYRLKLTKLPERDSLPETLFQLTELRELTIKGCRLCVLNCNICKLSRLEYLNLDKNKLVRLPDAVGRLKHLRNLVVSRNLLETLPESVAGMNSLEYVDAWGNPLYVLPESITALKHTLKVLDLRQIPLTKSEYDAMEILLPYTEILFTDICECENRRDHD